MLNVEELKKEILNIDWDEFNGPEGYESNRVADSLILLAEIKDAQKANDIGNKVTYAIGNDHAGVYYPAVLSALDFIIILEKNSDDNNVRKICCGAILNNLYYFEPELGSYNGCTSSELKSFVVDKLQSYSDE